VPVPNEQPRKLRVSVKVWTLQDWRPDALPNCTNPTCSREINNGEQYILIPGTTRILCFTCASQSTAWKDSMEVAAAQEKTREPAKKPRASRARKKRTQNLLTKPPAKPREPVTLVQCPVCWKWFRPHTYSSSRKQTRQIYCSVDCYNTVRPKVTTYICVNCERPYWPSRVNAQRRQTCCSRSCAWYQIRGRKNPNPPPISWTNTRGVCRECGLTAHRHRGLGLCAVCYMRDYRHKRRDKENKSGERVA
jgi:hypothetical protein